MTYDDIKKVVLAFSWHWRKIAARLTPSQWQECEKLKGTPQAYHVMLIIDKCDEYRIIYSNLLASYPIYDLGYKPPKALQKRLARL